jgi:surface polysaccharide O-acyltransferase-like enzyme
MVHATTFNGFTDEGVISMGNFMAGVGRYLAYACVPLFMMLTGFLSSEKKPTFNYYFKLVKIIIEFFIVATVVALVNVLLLGDTTSVLEIIDKILHFSYPQYSWYVNMFIGLYLLAPFLNYGYKAIPEKYKWLFIITLLIIFTSIDFTTYWRSAYPLMYYFIGLFIQDKKFEFKKLYLVLTLIGLCLLQTLFYMFPILYGVESHNNIGCVLVSTTIFLLFYNYKIAKPNRMTKTLRCIANASLSTYLVSEIFDKYSDILFNNWGLVNFSQRHIHLIYMTPIKFILSLCIGIVINIVATKLYKLLKSLVDKKRKPEIVE